MDKSGACNGGDQADVDPAEVMENMDEESAAKEKLTSADESKVKFTSVKLDGFDGKNGEAKVDIQVSQTTVGMGKEELMKYANEPFWVRLRMFLFVFFWIAWLAMLVGAVVIIVLAPRCPPAPKIEWYQKSSFYQVDVQKFKDSDGDGIGDLKGLISKLDYFKQHHIEALMLGNMYKTSNSDGIIDHKEVDSKVGTLQDFDELVQQLKEKDIRLVLDFNPNHSSEEHPWFQKSIERQDEYKDFYVWSSSPNGRSSPPNNWLSVTGGSAWTWNENRKEYYLHSFEEDKPDFNLRSDLVKLELKEVLKFWLDRGVDGFRVIATSHMVESKDQNDEPLGVVTNPGSPQYKDLNHVFTLNQPENVEILADWKELLLNFSASTGIHKILAPELTGRMNISTMYFGNATYPLCELPYNTHFTHVSEDMIGHQLHDNFNEASAVPAHVWPTMLLGSKDVSRLATRVGENLVDALHMVSIFARGTPITYYADELGVTNSAHHGNKASETIMLWSNDTFSGFTNGSKSEFTVHPDYATHNVEAQDLNKQSHLSIFTRLLALRGQPALNFGLQEYPIVNQETFSLLRVRKGSPGYLVVVNLGMESMDLDFTGESKYLPEMARVEIRSGNLKSGLLAEGDHPKVSLNKVPLDSKQAVIFSFVPVFD